MRNILASLLIMCAVNTAQAEQKFALMGVGTVSCAEFAKAYRGDPIAAGKFFFSWAQGYMSGINRDPLLKKQPIYNLAAQTTDQQQTYIAQFCDQHPLALYLQAVLSLLETIPKVAP